MNEKTEWILGVLILLLVLILFYFSIGTKITSSVIKSSNHSFTKAICDGKSSCRDYQINCKGKKLISISPTGFAIQTNNQINNSNLNSSEYENLCR